MSGRFPRFRLIHGVTIAAIALLALKAIGFFVGAAGPEAGASKPPQPGPSAGFGRALTYARTDPSYGDPTTTASVDKKRPSGEEAPKTETASSPIPAPPLAGASASERSILERLGERREELQQRTREMEVREKLIQEQERRLDDRLGQAKAAEDAKKSAEASRVSTPGPELKNLVTMYENMKPKEAARVFDRLPLDVLLSVVTQMNSRKMSEILAVMSPEGAEKLTVALASRAKGDDQRVSSAGSVLPPGELPAIAAPVLRKAPGLSGR